LAKDLTVTVETEIAKEQNRPVELYEVFLDPATIYLAANNVNVSFFNEAGDPTVFTAFNITRSAVRTNVSSRCDEVTVTLGNVNLTMGALAAYSDMTGKRCRIIQVFLDNILPPATPDPADFVPIFEGKLDDPQINEMSMTVKVVYSLDFLGLTLPRRKYQRNCGWKFGSAECTKSIGTVTGTVTTINGDGVTLTLSGRTEAEGWFVDGAITVGTERRRIMLSSAGTFVIDYPFDFAVATDAYSVRRGCNKTWDTCNTRYANTINYGGFLSVPTERTLLRV
jgi:phage-related protein